MSNRIEDLHPQLQPMFRGFIDACADEGIPTRVISTARSAAQQDALYAIGRTVETHRRPVTNARGYQSYHVWRCAADIAPTRVLAAPDWMPAAPEWVEMERIAHALGIEHDVPGDKPHWDYKGGGHWRRWREQFPSLVLPDDYFKDLP